jgi:hypothetical protein
MNSLPLFSIAARNSVISAMTRSYIAALGTFLPIGAGSPGRPKEPVNGFSQITCFPARTASTIICACSAGGVQISTTLIAGSARSAR